MCVRPFVSGAGTKQQGGNAVKRCLHVVVAESEDSRFIRGLVPRRRRIRHVAGEQECLDVAYAGVGDIMLLDIEDRAFAEPEFVSRVRFVSRSAFPILGIASSSMAEPERWLRAGMAEILYRETLTPFLLDRAVRHWVKHHRLKYRLFEANRRALTWWKDLVSVLDEVRLRLEKSGDSMEAYLSLLDTAEQQHPSLRRKTIRNARQQLTELDQLGQELDVAARTIQLEGIERSKDQPRSAQKTLFSAESLVESAVEEERSRSLDPPSSRGSEHRKFGT